MGRTTDPRPLIVHVVYRFAVGGLENGVVNLINRLPSERWRHAVVSLTDVDPGFAGRVRRADTEMVSLHKPPGQGIWLYPALWRVFRHLRPAIVHTRNLAALEAQVPAWAAGVRARLHGEHGRDAEDPDGRSRRHVLVRRGYRPFVQHYVALSRELADYLVATVGVPGERVSQICNGVDRDRFAPAPDGTRAPIAGCPFNDPSHWIVGTVGRMQTVKAQPMLARAFVDAVTSFPELRSRLRLVMIGDGPLRSECEAVLAGSGLSHLAWMPGERADVAEVMRGLDCFVLPSLAEGISNTILEAMSSGLPVLATRVGGNAELVSDGQTGLLVLPGDQAALTDGLVRLSRDTAGARAMGRAGRQAVEQRFGLQEMMSAYENVYDRLIGRLPKE